MKESQLGGYTWNLAIPFTSLVTRGGSDLGDFDFCFALKEWGLEAEAFNTYTLTLYGS